MRGGFRQQQRRHLRPRLPLADRLRPEDDLRHLGRHPGFRFRRATRRHHRHRRQPDRRPSGLRLAHEEAAPPGRQADRHRPARASTSCARRMSRRRITCRSGPAPTSRCSPRWPMSSSPRGWSNEAFVRERCDWDAFQDWAAFVADPQEQPRGGREDHRRAGRDHPRRGAALRHRRQRRDLLRPRRHRAQPGLDDGDGDRQPRHGDRQHRPARASA